MATLNNLQVVLQLNTSGFTTQVTQAGQQLGALTATATATTSAVNNLSRTMSHTTANIIGWTVALGEARHAVHLLYDIFGKWIEKIISVNSHIEQTVMMMAGFSNAATQAERIKEGFEGVRAAMQLAANTPFRLDSIHDVFTKLKVAGLDPLNGGLKALSDAVSAFGGNDEKFKHAAYAIQDMAGKGVISMEELRRQLGQHIPNAMPMMARAMNVTVQELVAAVSKGTVESKHAIEAMFAEFDRTFSGAAAERMNTLSGAIAQVTTSLMHLSQVAAGNEAGATTSDSFYKTLIDGVKQFNEALSSPEMNGAAVRINIALKSFADGVIYLIPYLPKLAENLDLIGKAFEVLFAIVVSKAIGAAMTALGGIFIQVAGGLGYLVGGVRSFALALPGMIAAIPTAIASVGALGSSIALNVGIVGAAVTGASTALGAFAAGLGVLALPVAVIAGLTMLSLKLGEVKGRAAEAGDALRRLAMGDYSKSTQTEANKELLNLQDKLALLQKNKDIADRIASGNSKSIANDRSQMTNVGGYLDRPDINVADEAARIKIYGVQTEDFKKNIINSFKDISAQVGAEIALLTDKIKTFSDDLAEAPTQMAMNRAQTLLARFRQEVASRMQKVDREYDDVEKTIAEARKMAGTLPQQDRDSFLSGLTNQSMENVKSRYDNEMAVYQRMLGQQRQLLDQALAANNKDQISALRILLDEIQKEIDAAKIRADKAMQTKGLGIVTTDTSKDADKQKAKLIEYIQAAEGRIAQLNDVLSGPEGTLGVVAKLRQAFEQGGQFALVGSISDIGKMAIETAEKLEYLMQKQKSMKEMDTASDKINNAYQKAALELEGYMLKLSNPNMAEAQRTFVLEQYRMGMALQDFQKNMDVLSIDHFVRFLKEANTAAAALNMTLARIDLSTITGMEQSLETKLRSSLPPAQKAIADAAADTKKVMDALNSFKANPLNANNPTAIADAEKSAKNALAMIETTKNNNISRAGARASAPADNTVTQLIGRLEEMRAQAADTGSEYAKWLGILDSPTSRGKYEAQRDQILALAKDIDMMKEKVKLAQEANRALDAIRHDRTSTSNELSDTRENLMAGKRLDVEREIAKFRKNQENSLSRIKEGYPDKPELYSKARADADAAINDKGLSALLVKAEANRTTEEQIRQNFSDTLSARRVAGNAEIEFERSHMQRLIDLYAKNTDDRKALQDGLNSYIAARNEELARKTENALQAQARDWRDIEANLASFGANAMDSFIDNMVEKLATGKASWTDFANWAIKELLRIQMKAALAPASDLLGKLAGSVGSALSGMLGGSTPKVGTVMSAEAATQFGGYHTGGLVGTEPTFMRSISESMFASAPRFHTGGMIGSDERPIIAKVGEGVFTPGQMNAIGNLNYNYAFVQSALTQLVSAMNSMVSAPARNDNMSGSVGGGSRVPVTINIDNQSSQPVSAVASTPRFDVEGMVVDIVLRNISSPGPLRSAVKDMR